MNFCERLKNLRTNKGLTQEELANILDINRVQYNQYENDYNTIPVKHLNSLANFFNVSIDYLLGFNSEASYNYTSKELDNLKAGNRLKEFRKENNLTQLKLAQYLNTNQSVVANYERGRTIIATSFLCFICQKYRVSADYLLAKTKEPKYLK